MAQISISFNGTAQDLDDFCAYHGYIEGAETKTQFFQRKVKEFAWDSVKAYRSLNAEEAARQSVGNVSF